MFDEFKVRLSDLNGFLKDHDIKLIYEDIYKDTTLNGIVRLYANKHLLIKVLSDNLDVNVFILKMYNLRTEELIQLELANFEYYNNSKSQIFADLYSEELPEDFYKSYCKNKVLHSSRFKDDPFYEFIRTFLGVSEYKKAWNDVVNGYNNTNIKFKSLFPVLCSEHLENSVFDAFDFDKTYSKAEAFIIPIKRINDFIYALKVDNGIANCAILDSNDLGDLQEELPKKDIANRLIDIAGPFCNQTAAKMLFSNTEVTDDSEVVELLAKIPEEFNYSKVESCFKKGILDSQPDDMTINVCDAEGQPLYVRIANDIVFFTITEPPSNSELLELNPFSQIPTLFYFLSTARCVCDFILDRVLMLDSENERLPLIEAWLNFYKDCYDTLGRKDVDYDQSLYSFTEKPSGAASTSDELELESTPFLGGMNFFTQEKPKTRITGNMTILESLSEMAKDTKNAEFPAPGVMPILSMALNYEEVFEPADPYISVFLGLDSIGIYGSDISTLVKECLEGSLANLALLMQMHSHGNISDKQIKNAVNSHEKIELCKWSELSFVPPLTDYNFLEDEGIKAKEWDKFDDTLDAATVYYGGSVVSSGISLEKSLLQVNGFLLQSTEPSINKKLNVYAFVRAAMDVLQVYRFYTDEDREYELFTIDASGNFVYKAPFILEKCEDLGLLDCRNKTIPEVLDDWWNDIKKNYKLGAKWTIVPPRYLREHPLEDF